MSFFERNAITTEYLFNVEFELCYLNHTLTKIKQNSL